jgi:hypothetical protein
VDDVRKDIQKLKYQIGRLLPEIQEDGKSWLRGPKFYTRVVEPHKKKKNIWYQARVDPCNTALGYTSLCIQFEHRHL